MLMGGDLYDESTEKKNMFSVDIEDLSQLCSNGSRHWLQAQGDLPGVMNQ